MPGTFFTPALAADITRECAAELGLEPAGLPTVDPRALPAAADAVAARMEQHADRWGPAALARVPLAPVVDGDVLPTMAAGGRAFLHELTWPAPGMGGMFGACPGLDVPLVFGNLTAGQPAVLIGEPTPAAEGVSEHRRRACTAFAATGDPGWPDHATGATRLFDVEPTATDYPEQASREIWREPPPVLDLLGA